MEKTINPGNPVPVVLEDAVREKPRQERHAPSGVRYWFCMQLVAKRVKPSA